MLVSENTRESTIDPSKCAQKYCRLAWKAFGNPDETLGAPLDAAERARVSAMSLRELCAEIHAGHEQCKALVARVRPGEGEYIGVRRGKRGRTFEAQIRRPGTGMQFLGTFCTAAEAAHAYDNAAFKQDGQCGPSAIRYAHLCAFCTPFVCAGSELHGPASRWCD